MKKVLFFLLTLAAMLPWAANAQETLTVYNTGTAYNSRVPAYALYFDMFTKSQFVIPATELSDMNGGSISSIKFYVNSLTNSSSLPYTSTCPVDVYLKEVSYTSISEYESKSSATIVYSGTLTFVSGGESGNDIGSLTIEFNTPFTYNGGNLLIGIENTSTGGYQSIYFSGAEVPGASISNSNSSLDNVPAAQQNFIPKTTFTYQLNNSCPRPTSVWFYYNPNLNDRITIGWSGGSGTFNCQYKKVSEDTWITRYSNYGPGYYGGTLFDLTSATDYQARVQSICVVNGDTSFSDWKYLNFTTRCDAVTTFPWSEDFESYPNGNFTSTCWENEHISGTGAQVFKITDGSNGNNSEHQLMLPDQQDNTLTKLLLPKMTLPGDNYQFSIDVYRNNSYVDYTSEGIRVFASADGEIDGATELAFIPRVYSVSNSVIPAETSNGWYTYELPIGMSGTCYIILQGENQYGAATYMDNFKVEMIPSCKNPTDLQVQNITSQSAELSWNANGVNCESFTYIVDKTADFDPTNTSKYVTATGGSAVMQNLTPYTHYTVAIRANCGTDGESRWSKTISFTTMPDCGAQAYRQFTIGNHTLTSSTLPFESFASSYNDNYAYGASWQIFTAEEIINGSEFPGAIKGLAWKSDLDASIPFQIYLANTDKSYFENDNDTVSRANMTKVYDGTTQFVGNQWSEIIFDTPFNYDASGNLLVMVYRPAPAVTSTVYFEYTRLDDTRTIYKYGPDGLSAGYTTNNRTNTRFTMCVTEDACLPVQNLTISSPTPIGAEFSWEDGRNTNVSTYEFCMVLADEPIGQIYGYNVQISEGVFGGTINQCTPSTTYDFYVRARCGASAVSVFKKVTFTTECDYQTLPYTCGFEEEDGVTGSSSDHTLPGCWHRYNDATSHYNYYPYVYNSTSYANNGSQALDFYCQRAGSVNSYGDHQIAVLPPVSPSLYPMNENQISFWARTTTSNIPSTLQIGTMTDPNDANTFVVDATLELTVEYTEYVVRFNSTGSFPAIMMTASSSTQSAYVDDITVDIAPACPKPLRVHVDTVTNSSATISWAPGGDETEWCIQYEMADGLILMNPSVTDNPHTLYGLYPNSLYSVKVYAKCSASESSAWSTPASFRTLCDATTPLPYTEEFETYTHGISSSLSSAPSGYPDIDLPYCWSFPNMAQSSNEYPQTYLANGNNGKVMVASTKTSSGPWYGVLPKFPEPIDNLMISFSYAHGSGAPSTKPLLKVGYMTDPNDPSTFIERYACAQSTSEFTLVELIMDSIVDPSNAYIAFKAEPRYSSDEELFLDNIKVEVIPTCFKPTDLSITSHTHNSVSLSWEDPQQSAGYQIAYGPARSFNLNNTSTYSTKYSYAPTYTVTGLESGTNYTFAVRANCSDDDWSKWSLTTSAQTSCLLTSLPYTENFDSYTAHVSSSDYTPSGYPDVSMPDCWTFLNRSLKDNTSYPLAFLTTSSNYSSSGNALLLHSTSSTPIYAILPAFEEPLNNLQISFKYSYYRENSSSGTLTLGYMTDLGDPTTFHSIYTCRPNTDIVSVEQYLDTVTLPQGGDYVHLAFQYQGASAYVGIDDVEVKEIPECRKPELTLADNWFGSRQIYFYGINPNAVENDTFNYQIAYGLAETFDLDNTSTYSIANRYDDSHDFFNMISASPDLEYSFAIRVQCSDNTWSEWSNVVTKKTECNVVSLPYEEYFDTYTEGISTNTGCPSIYPNVDLPECWTFYNPSEYRTEKPQVFLTSSRDYSKSGNSLMLYASENTPVFAMLPKFFEAGGSQPLKISFYYANTSTSSAGTLSIGYVHRNNEYYNFNLYTELYSCPITTDMTFIEQVIDSLPNGARITLRYSGGSSSYGVWIDEVEVVPASTCPDVNITDISYISDNMVNVSFDGEELTDGSYYKLACGPASTFDRYDPSTYESLRSFSFGLGCFVDNLQPNTEYAFAMAIICPGEVTGNWSRVATAKTRCEAISTLPYTEDFNSYTHGVASGTWTPDEYPDIDLPECWTFQNTSYSSPAFLTSSSSYAVSGNSLVFYPASNDTIIAILPSFEEDIRNLKLTFSYKNYYTTENYPGLSIGYMTGSYNAPVDFYEIAQLDKSSSWTEAEVLFESVSEWEATHYPATIAIKCASPRNSGRVFIDNIMVESTLDPCDPVVVNASRPYTDDFESDQCWQLINGEQTNAWAQGTATNNGGNNALYISNDNGVSNAYTLSSNSMVYATKQFALAAGQYDFQYDWKADGESGHDYLRVALVPANTQLTAGSTPSGFGITSLPTGWIALDGGSKLNLQSDWTTMSITDIEINEDGDYMVVFAWRNDNSAGTQPPAAIDNFSISAVNCMKPTNLQVQDITSQSANLYWNMNEPRNNTFTYIVDKADDFDTSSTTHYVNVYDSPAFIQNLDSYTTYAVSVRTNCGSEDHSRWSKPFIFTTLPDCGEQASRQFVLGTETNFSYSYLFYSYPATTYQYAASWQIFTADEILNGSEYAGTIKGLAWKSDIDASIPFQIYLANTDKSSFTSSTDTIDRSTMTLVYDGTTQFRGNQWSEIVFNTPFEYDATGNLLIMVYRPAPQMDQTVSFEYSSQPSYMTAYRYGSSATLSSGSSSSYRTNTRFTMCVTEDECLPVQDLTAKNITDSELSLSWTDMRNTDALRYHVEYGYEGFSLGTGLYSFAYPQENGFCSFQLTDLEPNTTYDIYVYTLCDDYNNNSIVKKVTVTTECTYITELPYTCGFEVEEGIGTGSHSMPDCWHRYNDGNLNNNYYPYVYNGSSSAHHGNRSLYFYSTTSSSGSNHQIAVLPPISAQFPMNENQMVLWAKYSSNPSATITIGTMTDPYDPSTFVADSTIELTLDHREYVVKFNSTGIFPAILMTKSSVLTSAYVDDITIDVVPSCPKPMYVSADNMTQTSASISWTPGGEETLWEVKCIDVSGSDTLIQTATTNPFVFNGLQPSTRYNVYVSAICGEDGSSQWSAPGTFITVCTPLATLPYIENFDSYTHGVSTGTSTPALYPDVDLPDCWTFLNRSESSSSLPRVFLTSNYNYIVSGNALFFQSSRTTPLYAVLPTFTEDVHNLMLSFTYRNESVSTSNGTLSVGYMTNPTDASTFVELRSFEQTTTKTPAEMIFNTIPADVTASNIAFKYTGGTTDNYYLSIDEVTVEEILACTKPIDLAVSNIGSNTVSLTWTSPSNASNFQVAYAPSATIDLENGDYQTLSANTTSALVDGLSGSTEYTFAVRVNCGDNEWSDWSWPVSATTLCDAITTLPYTENFDSYTNGISSSYYSAPSGYPNVDMPDCWLFFNRSNNTSNYPRAFLTSYSSYVVSGNGLILCNNNSTPIYAMLPPFAEDVRNLMLTFTYRNESASNALLSVGYMTNPTDPNTFVELNSLELTTTKTPVEMVFTSIPAEANASYIAFKYIGSSSAAYSVSIDNVTVQLLPSCLKPTDLVVADVSTSAVELAWTGNSNTDSAYLVAYAPSATFSLDNESYQTLWTNTNSLTISGLSNNTQYTFAVRVNCGNNDWSDWSAPVSATTLCLPITELPYTCGFEPEDGVGTESHAMPDCWYRYNDATSTYNYYPYVSSGSSTHYGTHYLYMYSTNSTAYADNQVAVLPQINTSVYPMNGNQMVLWARNSSNPSTIIIGTMTNPYDLSTFVADDSLTITSSTYREYVVKFNSTGSFPAILMHKSATSASAYVDDITIEVVPSCPKPMHVNVDTITETSATISWTANGEETQWEVKCVSMDSTDIQTQTVSSNPFVFSGLQPATRYNVYVKAICSSNEESVWSAPGYFRTVPSCPLISTLPYTCGFEDEQIGDGSNVMPDCWNRYNDATGSSIYYPYVSSSSSSNAYHGTHYLYFYSYTSSGYADNQMAVLPEINTSIYPMNGNQMVLWAKSSSSNTPSTIKIGTMTNPYDLSTFVLDDSLVLTSSYREYVVKFNSTGAFPAILMTKSFSGQYAYLDDITIEVVPSCPKPMHANVDTTTETSATISWTSVGEENQWEVKCVSMDNTDIQTLTATTNPFVFIGLQPGTKYDFYVRAICGYNDESVWSEPAAGRTIPVCSPIATLPYMENFDSYLDGVSTSASTPTGYPNVDLPDCWTFLNRSESTSTYPRAFLTSSTNYAVAGNALFFMSSSTTPLYAVLPPFVEDVRNLMLSFTYRNEGVSESNGTLSVGYMTDPTDTNTFVELRSFEQTTTKTSVEMIFNTIPAEVTVSNIAFKYTGGTNNNFYLGIDDVMVTVAPVEECPAISQLPYTEDFNSYNNVSSSTSTPSDYPNVGLPECWTFLNRSDTSASYPQAFLTSYTSYAVSGNALFFKSSNTTPLYAVLPTFAEDIRNLMLSFTYRNESVSEYNGTLSVGYMTDPTDASTFVELRSFEQTTTKTPVDIVLDNIPANVTPSNIAFKYTGGSAYNYYLSIDDVIVQYPTCLLPRELTLTEVTTSSVSLTWTDDNGDEGSYQVAYAPSATFNLADGEDYDVVWTNTNSATISGLSDATEYTFAVRTSCNDEEFSNWSAPITVKTLCSPLAELPYTIGFEENIEHVSYPMPECWFRYNDAINVVNYYPYVSRSTSDAHSGSYYLRFYSIVDSEYADHMIAVLPNINTNLYPMDESQMVLWAKGTYTPTIQIGTMTDPSDLSTFVADSSLTLTNEYLEYVVKFHSNGAYPAILLNKGSVDRLVYIDDITIDVAPSCPKPLNVTAYNITEIGATISWTSVGEETQWEVKCVSMDSTDIQTLTVTTNPFTTTSLLSGTRYNVYVRAFCGDNNWSEWSTPTNLKTSPVCLPIATLPYTEDFDSYTYGVSDYISTPIGYYPNVDMPDCWTFLNRSESSSTYPQAFLTSHSPYTVSSNALFFKSSSTTPLYAVLPTFVENVRNLMLSFTYRNESVSEHNGTLSVGYLTDPADASTFVEIRSFEQTTTLTPMEVSFSEIPAGVTASNIAFKYTGGSSNNYYLSIDDVTVVSVAPACAGITVPYEQGFESESEAEVTDCWTFLPDVDNAMIPQISYGNAQSGNNSLAMTSRGIYVMPEITNVENVHNLIMTFYVKQRKFAHRIAVGVMTDPTDPTTFIEIDRFFNDGNYSTPVQQTVNFSSYSGSGKYIAFRNVATNSDALSNNWIDDISISEAEAVSCNGITIPYEENFDAITTNTGAPTGVSPDCWTFLPDVSNATIPQVSYGSAYAQSGNYSLAMTSRGIYVLPEITNVDNVNGLALSFYVRQKKYAQRIAVGVMTDPTDPTTFVEIDRFFNDGNYSTPVYHIMDFSSYTGNGKYIAFRNVVTNSDATSQNWIDDINIFEGQAVTCNGITIPYEENFDSITTSTGAPTGASPACWTFLPDVDNATIPQVSYGADNAQSGNYSLAMTSRGIYVMPEITNIDNVSDLVMTFYVKQRKFAHRIAVGVMTDPTDPATFVEIERFYNEGNYSTLVQHSVNFSSYTGSGKYIAFRNVATNSDALSNNWIDDISLQEFCGITVPYVQNFDSLTTNTGASTGVSPRCWTFLPDVDNASIPQVSYGADNAQSGNYSLAMTSRGIYVMPEIINVDNVNNLTMTFYVKQRKFAHRIAVGVMTDPTDPTTFTEIDRFFNDGNYSTPVQQTVNFASYTGNGKYIAFRNVATNSDALSNNWIDDINITEAEAVACEGITIPYSENFDAITTSTGAPTGVSPACWTFLPDVDNATIPQVSYGTANAQSGNYSLAMTSRGIYVMPEITNVDNVNNLTMTFYVKQRKFANRIAVGVMTDPTDPTTFVEIDRFFNDGNYTTLVQQTVDFSSYTGNGKYIAFRNVTTSTDASSQNWIDDINITEAEAVTCNGITVPYTQNFDAITSNTGAPTGVSPACWTFLPDVDNATIPQISYGSANAQSGDYSLAMTNRGIYAMPEITNVESVSGLTMTFYVKQRKYAHRIAVGVMTDPTDPTTFTEIERFFNGGDYTNPVQHTVDFSSYTGTGKYIAFRNVTTNSDVLSNNWIDDIDISVSEPRTADAGQDNGRTTDDFDADYELAPLGIDDFDLSDFTVWPNPTTGELTLGMEAQRVEMLSLTGQRVALFENTSHIDISTLPSGVYILKATLPQGEAVRKVVKR